jgi:hypothetical protein
MRLEKIYFPLNLASGDQLLHSKTGKVLYEHKGKLVNYSFLGFEWKGRRGLTIKNQKELNILVNKFIKVENEKLILKVAKYLNDIDGRSYACWSETTKSDQQFYLKQAKVVIKIVKEFKNE